MLKREFKEVNGHRWAYLRRGHGQPLVLVHGILNLADYFAKIFDLCDKDFDIIAPDLPGSGSTLSLKDNSYKNIATELGLFLRSFKLPPFSCFGASLGGTILLELALDSPELFGTLFVQSPLWRQKGLKNNLLERFEKGLAELPAPVLKLIKNPLVLRPLLKFVTLIRPDLSLLFKKYEGMIVQSLSLADSKGSKELYVSLEKADLPAKIHALNVRSVLMVGEDDLVVPPSETVNLAKRIKKDLVVVLRHEDHEMILDAPEKIAKIIKNYLLDHQKAQDPAFIWKEI